MSRTILRRKECAVDSKPKLNRVGKDFKRALRIFIDKYDDGVLCALVLVLSYTKPHEQWDLDTFKVGDSGEFKLEPFVDDSEKGALGAATSWIKENIDDQVKIGDLQISKKI